MTKDTTAKPEDKKPDAGAKTPDVKENGITDNPEQKGEAGAENTEKVAEKQKRFRVLKNFRTDTDHVKETFISREKLTEEQIKSLTKNKYIR